MALKRLFLCLAFLVVVCAVTLLLVPNPAERSGRGSLAAEGVGDEDWVNPYGDVTPQLWSYDSICRLNQVGILPSSSLFRPTTPEQRGDFVANLYRMAAVQDRLPEEDGESEAVQPVFADVPQDSENATAIAWAVSRGVASGVGEDSFQPTGTLSREQLCTLVCRYADAMGLRLAQINGSEQFTDSLSIQNWARSSVVACRMAGLVSGYPDGSFAPEELISREEAAAILYQLYEKSQSEAPEEARLVNCSPGAYDALYDSYTLPPIETLVAEGEPVPVSYFDDAVFVGDSVSLRLQYYCAGNQALGGAQFLCAGSLSATNALWDVSSASVHPVYRGKKMLVEDGVAASGAKKVYIMLGGNNVSFGLEKATGDMLTLIARIQEKSPKAQIIIQSVTPITSTSNLLEKGIDNEKISAYNAKMLELCQENRWYYIDLYPYFVGEDGFLRREYCSDPDNMGMHFTPTAAKLWVELLRTHAPVIK